MNRRKTLLTLAAVGAAPLAALAQPPGKVWRIGILAQGARPASLGGDSFGNFVRGLRELGYVEGKKARDRVALCGRRAGKPPRAGGRTRGVESG